MASTNTKEAIDALETIAKGSDAAKAKAAIDALASTNTKEAIDALETIAKGSDAAKAKAAIDALASTNTSEAQKILLIIRNDPASPQADAAAAALQRMSPPSGSSGATSGATTGHAARADVAEMSKEDLVQHVEPFAHSFDRNGLLSLLRYRDDLSGVKKGFEDNVKGLASGGQIDQPSLLGWLMALNKKLGSAESPEVFVRRLYEAAGAITALDAISVADGNTKTLIFSSEGGANDSSPDFQIEIKDVSGNLITTFVAEVKQSLDVADGNHQRKDLLVDNLKKKVKAFNAARLSANLHEIKHSESLLIWQIKDSTVVLNLEETLRARPVR